MIAETCPLILPIHRDLDALREDASGAGKIGTTRRGIGPAYEDKVGRRAIRVCDLAQLDDLGPLLDRLCAHHDALRAGFGEPPVDRERLRERPRRDRRLRPAVRRPVWRDLDVRAAQRQAHPVRGRARRAARRRPRHLSVRHLVQHGRGNDRLGQRHRPVGAGFVLGIVKAYTTRVGSGPFPTEQDNEIGQQLGERGHEFGTVTGRRRRCGWFDAVLVRQAVAVSGVTGVALTKLDVLDGFETVKICTGYQHRRRAVRLSAAHAADQMRVEPVYEEIEGWPGSTRGARSWADLPARAIKYVRRIEELIRCPVALVSDLARARRHDPGAGPVRGLVPHLEIGRGSPACDFLRQSTSSTRADAAGRDASASIMLARRPASSPSMMRCRPGRRGNCGPSR